MNELTLPEDLLMDILVSMPAAQVLKFRCLSKFYLRLITSSDFVRKHYDRQIKTRQPSVLVCSMNRRDNRSNLFLVDLESTVPNKVPDLSEKGAIFNVVGCCRGFICYRSHPRFLSLWNPCTGTCLRILETDNDEWNSYCLGYDPLTDDIKLVEIGFQQRCGRVYSSNSGSWRKTDDDTSMMLRPERRAALVLEATNSANILCRDRYFDTSLVLAFDFAEEKFNLFKLPRHLCGCPSLLSLDGCLCVSGSCDDDDGRVEVWKMKEYGVDESWTRIFCLKNNSTSLNLVPLTFVNINNGGRLQLLAASDVPGSEIDLYLCRDAGGDDQGQEPKQLLRLKNTSNSIFLHSFPFTPSLFSYFGPSSAIKLNQ